MNGSYLLDTNIVIALFGNEPGLQTQLSQARETFVPSVVLGELYYGAYRSQRVEANVQRVREFGESAAILDCTRETASRYGTIKNAQRVAGKPLPENDIWIAALAIEHDLTLVFQGCALSGDREIIA